MAVIDGNTRGGVPLRSQLLPYPPSLPVSSQNNFYLYATFFLNLDMSQPSSSSSFQSLFNAALKDYANKTGSNLDDNPLAIQLQSCDSVDSISSVLQDQARRFHEFRGEDGKIMKSLKSATHILYTLSTSTTLGEGVGIVSSMSLMADFSP